MSKVLALDLGTNSIGWAIRNLYLTDNQIERFGVSIFQKGVGTGKSGEFSLAAERTKNRSIRRLYQSRKYRIWATLKALIEYGYCPLTIEELDKWRHYQRGSGRTYPESLLFDAWIKLDFNNDGAPDYISPYQLRRKAIHEPVSKYELGRIFYHIAQRRGFKSSRKTGDTEKTSVYSGSKESGAKGVNEIKDLIASEGTLGAALARIEETGERIRNRYTLRKHYQEEVEKICEVQGIAKDSPFYKEINQAIFFQRPLRSQKGLVGKCTLEPGKYRCPVSHPDYEAFRAWSFLNNITYRPDGDPTAHPQRLPLPLKQELYHDKFFRKTVSYFDFEELEKAIAKKGYKWKLNYKSKTTVTGCPISARLKEIFGEEWHSCRLETDLSKQVTSKAGGVQEHKVIYTIQDIWHVLFSFEDEEKVQEFAQEKLGLNDEQIKAFVNAWYKMPDGYAMLSLNAIQKILPFLQQGFIYTEAVLLANMPAVLGQVQWQEKGSDITEAIAGVMEENRADKQAANIVNNLIAQYKALPNEEKYGVKDTAYQMDLHDQQAVLSATIETFGDKTWQEKDAETQANIIKKVSAGYQSFFADSNRDFKKLPHLLDSIKTFLRDNFDVTDKALSKLYHPSQIDIYPKSKTDVEGRIFLGSPKTGAFKNPMAMRTLHELRKLVNHLIEVGEIDEDTRVVVEVARELNDANKRWAIETWQKRREEENKEYAIALQELQRHRYPTLTLGNYDDIDQMRLWHEQLQSDEVGPEGKNEIARNDWRNGGSKLMKEIKTLKTDVEKYRLWKEQNCICLYTGHVINLTDLFDENVVDFEHTLPRSKSFDNSLANLTVCYANYNRKIKKNQLPSALPNYDEDIADYQAIKPRLKKWTEKVEALRGYIEFWVKKAKGATTKEDKDNAIRQRHLWHMEFDYWHNKVRRFTMEEMSTGFKNSQLVDTQIISKYALHYLRTVFNRVEVQKGSITADFRKIFGLQEKGSLKDRSKHSHHALDAAVLTLIPSSTKREELLRRAYESEERTKKTFTEKPYPAFHISHIRSIEEAVLINNIAKDQALTPAKKLVRKRGKIVLGAGENASKAMIATGDAIRGQLHAETFLGAIKKAKRDAAGKPLKDEEGKFVFEAGLYFVVREPLVFKANAQSPGFKSLEDLAASIVDPHLFEIIRKQTGERPFKDALAEGIWMLDKTGKQVNKMRHVRVFVKDKDPLLIRKHSSISKKQKVLIENRSHKEFYYASNASNYAYLLYQGEVKGKVARDHKIVSLFEAAQSRLSAEYQSMAKEGLALHAILKIGQKVLFYKDHPDELTTSDKELWKKRLYKIVEFEKDGRMKFKYHLEARKDELLGRGAPVLNDEIPEPKLRLSKGAFNFLIEHKDFTMTPAGEIKML